MSKAKLQTVIQSINKINFDNRKRPEVAKAASKEAIDDFVESEGYSREELIDRYQSKLEDNPSLTYYSTVIEMLKQYV